MTTSFVDAVAGAVGRLLNAALLGAMAAAVLLGAWFGYPYWAVPAAEREATMRQATPPAEATAPPPHRRRRAA